MNFFKTNIRAPRRREKAALRTMILIGLVSMFYFIRWILQPIHVGYAPLYWLIILTMGYLMLRILHEWYHYFFITLPKKPSPSREYTVDVLTTYCTGEPYEMIRETLHAIKNIRYPHESYLCDDAGDDYVKTLCKDLGINYVTRDNRKDAKAGNINNALRQATGEICVILDPDHVPEPDFIDKVIPYFEDPAIGYVQVVQAYKNRHESIVAKGAAQQTFQFYGPMMMTMNHYGTVQAIGANCTFRRAALDSIGGHAPGLAEDMHTAMQLHAKGWRSVYEPSIVARGLVPSTLSGYYKQQLKWARGTTDLLLKTYPRLFKSFTWRQRLHYGTIPFHYFSGFVFLLNFLIPVLALFFNLIPMKVDMIDLMLVGAPFATTILLIRHFVQRWVMDEAERGFHVMGGILHIGTWWINILGVLFTFLRIEVPYDPTPKDGKEGNTLKLNMPNIIIGVISLLAIVYGLYLDWSPFSLVMAFLAFTNLGFMVFMIIAGLQPKFREYQQRKRLFDGAIKQVRKARRNVWHLKHWLYVGFRQGGLSLSVLTAIICVYLYKFSPGPEPMDHFSTHAFYSGIYQPNPVKPGYSDLQKIDRMSSESDIDFAITSLYLPWSGGNDSLPLDYLNQVYESGSIPMITWEPWLHELINYSADSMGIMEALRNGEMDPSLRLMAGRFRDLERPVFLRFAHEADNPHYPWSEKGNIDAETFIAAWRHVYEVFDEEGAQNVIWVWNPWNPATAASLFPGEDYVDWIGLTLLNYAEMNRSRKWLSFDQLYLSFDSTGIFDYQLPVMLAEFGSLEQSGRQEHWFERAFEDIRANYPEIRATVFFNADADQNIPDQGLNNYSELSWAIRDEKEVFGHFKDEFAILADGNTGRIEPLENVQSPVSVAAPEWQVHQGVNFHKGKDWKGNYDELSMRTAKGDFRNIKRLGADVVKWSGPGIYDRNALRAAGLENLKIMYSFWIPEHLDFLRDEDRLAELEAKILKTVRTHKDNELIIAWNLGNDSWQGLRRSYPKPELFSQQKAYMAWMEGITQKIYQVDSVRPITLDIDLHERMEKEIEFLQGRLPLIASFGVRLETRDSLLLPSLASLEAPHFISATPPAFVHRLGNGLSFIEHYKDQRTANYASLGGLLDINGGFKPCYYNIQDLWTGSANAREDMELRIITPAQPIYPYQRIRYHVAMPDSTGNWSLAAEPEEDGLKYAWYLVRADKYGNYMRADWKGDREACAITIPENYEQYRLYLIVTNGERSWTRMVRLNRPFEVPGLASR